jgi:hypothetical protein
VGWALGQHRADLQATARRSFEAAFASELVAPVLSTTSDESLLAQGVLSPSARHELRRRAIEETLRPAAANLYA